MPHRWPTYNVRYMTRLSISVNGHPISLEIDPNTPLLWVLRDHLALTGTKYGCGMGLCGACTVHLDGVAARSCLIAVGSIGAKAITTIEGLSPDGTHRVQLAWIAEAVPQCGYCQPGQIMQATSLLSQIRHPTDEEIDTAMSGNICRCGTYPRIRRAIKRAAAHA